MITQDNSPVEWALLVTELDEARQHLDELAEKMARQEYVDESDFAVDLGHIYAHLNRAWHSRNRTEDRTNDPWAADSAFPKDLQPVG